MTQEEEKYQLYTRSINLLDGVIQKVSRPQPGQQSNDYSVFRHDFIYRHAQNILTLSRDILFLDQNNRSSSNFVLIRPMLESLFNLVAAVNNPSFAIEKMNDEAKHSNDKMERWIKYYGDSDGKSANAVSLVKNILQEWHHRFSINQRKWKTFEVAEKAMLAHRYIQDYCYFSVNIHANIEGIIAQEKQCGRQRILQITIYILLAIVDHVVRSLGISNPQSYIDESTRLLNEFNRMVLDGVFRESYKTQPHP